MTTNQRTGQMHYPFPMGKISPGSAFASASVPLTQNIMPVNQDGVTPDFNFNGIWIQADMNNSDTIYICSNASAPDLVNFSNVLGELQAGAWYPRTKEWAQNRQINTLFIGAKNAVDFVICSIDAV